jgi:hypothetical protein
MRISYASLLKFLIAFNSSSWNIKDVDVFFSLKTLLLENDAADNIELGANHEDYFISLGWDRLTRI